MPIKSVMRVWRESNAGHPFRRSKFRAMERLEQDHMDLCGLIPLPTPGGKRYFLLMVNDFSRFMWLVLLTTKDEAEMAIHRVKAGAEV
jgi:histone deacetylase 1/2